MKAKILVEPCAYLSTGKRWHINHGFLAASHSHSNVVYSASKNSFWWISIVKNWQSFIPVWPPACIGLLITSGLFSGYTIRSLLFQNYCWDSVDCIMENGRYPILLCSYMNKWSPVFIFFFVEVGAKCDRKTERLQAAKARKYLCMYILFRIYIIYSPAWRRIHTKRTQVLLTLSDIYVYIVGD